MAGTMTELHRATSQDKPSDIDGVSGLAFPAEGSWLKREAPAGQ